VGGGRCGALRRLSLKLNGLGDAGLRALVGGGALGALEALQVSHNTIRDEGVEALALGWPVGLARLDLEGNFVSAEGLRALRRPAAARALGWLNVDHNQLEEGAWDFFGEAPLEALVTLSARHNRLGPRVARALARSASLGRLRFLALSSNPLGDEGARALAEAASLGELACLEVERCQVGDAGALALARSARLGGLSRLSLGQNALGAAALAEVGASNALLSL
jgi:Ran GTPase-activating protein (RanGAP) involved in mRNA processing and transport